MARYQPKLYLRFEPSIYNDSYGIKELNKILKLIEQNYPEVHWGDSEEPSKFNPFTDADPDDGIPDQVKALTIGFWQNEPNNLTYGIWDDNDNGYTNAINGRLWVRDQEIDYDETSGLFNSLNESDYQPKLNLRFEEGISDADELDRVLKVLEIVYPGLKWLGNDPVGTHNVIRNNQDVGGDDFEYEPIHYLTIGYFPNTPDKLTYTSGPADDIDFSDSEQHGYNWVEGWQWVEKHDVDYDETSNLFNQLNESTNDENFVYPNKDEPFALVFYPYIYDPDRLDFVLNKLQVLYPDVMWVNKTRLIDYNPFKEEIPYDQHYGQYDSVIGNLTFNSPEWYLKGVSWGSDDESDIGVSKTYDGWEFINRIEDIDSYELFNKLD
jgi:hypothetical protein